MSIFTATAPDGSQHVRISAKHLTHAILIRENDVWTARSFHVGENDALNHEYATRDWLVGHDAEALVVLVEEIA